MTREAKILYNMWPDMWYKTWQLTSVHYDAGRLLRNLRAKGKVESKKEGKYTLFKIIN